MNRLIALLPLTLLAGCASDKLRIDKAAIDDFVAVRGLESVDSIRTDSSDGWTDVNDHYLIYTARRDQYLIRFSRACWQIRDNVVEADRRADFSRLRARFDTIRGCRIAEIFALSEQDATELRELGDAPPGG